MIIKIIFSLPLAALLLGCGNSATRNSTASVEQQVALNKALPKKRVCRFQAPPPWYANVAYEQAGYYVGVADDDDKQQASSLAKASVTQQIKATISQNINITLAEKTGEFTRDVHKSVAVNSELSIPNLKISAFQDTACRWHVLAAVSEVVVRSQLSHNKAEQLYAKITQESQQGAEDLATQQRELEELLALHETIDYEAILLFNQKDSFAKKYKLLQQLVSNSQVTQHYEHQTLLLLPAKLEQAFDQEAQQYLLNSVNVWDSHVPKNSVCDSLTQCVNRAGVQGAKTIVVVKVDSVRFTEPKFGIRTAYLTLTLKRFDAAIKPTTTVPLTGHYLTSSKAATDWKKLIDRLIKNNRTTIEDLGNLE